MRHRSRSNTKVEDINERLNRYHQYLLDKRKGTTASSTGNLAEVVARQILSK
jgi:hypothetical protein